MSILVRNGNIEEALVRLKKSYEKNGLREHFKRLAKNGYQTKGQKRRMRAMRSRARRENQRLLEKDGRLW